MQASFHWGDGASRPFIDKTEPTFSIQQRFHANTKISTISSQDGWLLLDELDHARFDAKTRGPVPLFSDEGRNLAFIAKRAESNVHSGVTLARSFY